MTTEPTLPLLPPTVPLPNPGAGPTPAAEAPSPRIRWAGIVWGAVLAAVAAFGLATIIDGSTRAAINDWLRAFEPATFNPGWVVAGVVMAAGFVLLVTGGIALLRRAQRRSAAS